MSDLSLHLPEDILQIDTLLEIENESWYAVWLAWLCNQLPQVCAGLVVADEQATGQFQALSIWPADTEQGQALQNATEETLRKQQALIIPLENKQEQIGSYPIFVEKRLRAVVTIQFQSLDEAALHKLLALVEFCSGWLELRLNRKQLHSLLNSEQRQRIVIDSVAQVLEEPDFDHAALRFVNLLGRHLNAERVVLGFIKNQEISIHSESDSSGHSKKHELLKLTTLALQETVDQQESILWPSSEGADAVTIAHQKLAEEEGKRCLMSIPLIDKELCFGAILFDRSAAQPFNESERVTAEALANFSGAVLEEKRQANFPLYRHALRSMRNHVSRLLGPGYLGRKVTLLCSVVTLIFLSLVEGAYNIGADAVIEGAELRAIVVPFDGYLQRADVRAGDSVLKGALIAELDTREFRLQRMSWISQQSTSKRQYEDALAKQERAQVQITKAQVERAQTEIELLDYQISQALMAAPFDALVVSGDLNQRIGSLVRQGEVLFELSPRERFRLAMYIDEFRINDVRQQQGGQLVLSALPDEKFPFVVTRINPMTEIRDGATVYRVEAEIDNQAGPLRVGLEGVAQVYVDDRLLISIWTRALRDWLKLQYWRFWG